MDRKSFFKIFVTAVVAMVSVQATASAQRVKLACVGDSITYGAGIKDRNMTYPKQLAHLLGPGYSVVNFGVSGTTALSKGNFPYVSTDMYKKSLEFKPNIVVLMFGTNDSKAKNIAHIAKFEADLEALIKSYQKLATKPKVFVCLPVPAYIYGTAPLAINGTVLADKIVPLVKKVAVKCACPIIDLNEPLSGRVNMFPDKIHPNAFGAGIMAKTIAEAVRK